MNRALVGAIALVNLTGCCSWVRRCCSDPVPAQKCWAEPSAQRFALVEPELITTLRQQQEKLCNAIEKNGGTISEALWADQCKRHFEFYVMREHCAPLIGEYCEKRCFDDRDSCSMAADTVLGTTCAERSFGAFKDALRYCADSQLKGKVLAPDPGGKPRCD